MQINRIILSGLNSLVGDSLVEQLGEAAFIDQLAGLDVIQLADDIYEEDPVALGEHQLSIQPLADFAFGEGDVLLLVDSNTDPQSLVNRASAAGALVVCAPGFDTEVTGAVTISSGVNGKELLQVDPGEVITLPDAASLAAATVAQAGQKLITLSQLDINVQVPVSAKGKAGVEDLAGQLAKILNGLKPEKGVFPEQVAFNLIPQIGEIAASGMSDYEAQVAAQVRALLDAPDLVVNITAQQAPVFFGYALAITMTSSEAIDTQGYLSALRKSQAIKLTAPNKPAASPVGLGLKNDRIQVGRVRQVIGNDRQVSVSATLDGPRNAAAGGLVALLEVLIKSYL